MNKIRISLKKYLVIGIILLFLGLIIVPISGLQIKKGQQGYVIVDGPSQGKAGVTYYYNFTFYHSDNKSLWLMIDWGDGAFVNWTGPYESNQTVTFGHSWNATGLYYLGVLLKDENGNCSDWGYMLVFIIKSRMLINKLLLRFIERFSVIEKLLTLISLI